MPAKTAPAPLSVGAFLQKAAARQLTIRLNANGDGLVFYGPTGAISDRVREYMRAAKPAILEHLRAKEQQQRVYLVGEFRAVLPEYDHVVEEGLAVEAGLRRQRDEAAADGYDDYEDRLYCAYHAAINGRMPRETVVLSPDRETTDPAFLLCELVKAGRLLRQQGKAEGAEGERIAADIRAITDWYVSPI